MNEKKFKYTMLDGFTDNNEHIDPHTVAKLLNKFYEINQILEEGIKQKEETIKQLKEDIDGHRKINMALNKEILKSKRKKHIYVVEAYAYSDYEVNILTHETFMSDKMFFKIVKEAQELCKNKNYSSLDYVSNLIACLCEEFGFESYMSPWVSVGSGYESKVRLLSEGNLSF